MKYLKKIENNGKWNFVTADGKLLSDTWFDYAWDFSDGYAAVQLNGKCYFIDTDGEVLSAIGFYCVRNFPKDMRKSRTQRRTDVYRHRRKSLR